VQQAEEKSLYGKRIMPKITEAVIAEYSDFFSNWWGLEDGTLLETSDPRGYMWIKVGNGRARPDHETVQRMIDARK
jgi:hypothetical protein